MYSIASATISLAGLFMYFGLNFSLGSSLYLFNYCLAFVISAMMNHWILKFAVFGASRPTRVTLGRYLSTATLNLLLSALGVLFLVQIIGINHNHAAIFVFFVLAPLSYLVNRLWVFGAPSGINGSCPSGQWGDERAESVSGVD